MNAVEFNKVSRSFKLHLEKRNSFLERTVNIFKPRGTTELFWALRDVSFEVPRGTTLGLVGHNGSGKSTTLKLVSRILEPTSGSVAVRGRVSALLELGSGFHPDLSGRDNVYLNGSLLGFSRSDMNRRIDEIIEFAELGQFIDMPVKHYSSGMYMRLGFAIATSVEPDILITENVPDDLKGRDEILGEAGLNGQIGGGTEQTATTGSSVYVPPDKKDDTQLQYAIRLIDGKESNAAYPPKADG